MEGTIVGGGGGNLNSAGARLSKPLGELQPATITHNFSHIAYFTFHLTQGDGHWPQFPGMYITDRILKNK